MAKSKQVFHAPKPKCDVEPLCGTRAGEPVVATVGQLINCRACLRALCDVPQHFNLLNQQGYMFPAHPSDRQRTGRKASKRQLTLGGDNE